MLSTATASATEGALDRPLVSVLMPVYNAERYLEEALRSVLEQSYAELEVVLVNDGSTDRSQAIIESFDDPRIRLLNKSNSGITKTLNYGLARCRGELVARMDADDICAPERIEKEVRLLRQRDADIVWSNAHLIDDAGEKLCDRFQPSEWWSVRMLNLANFVLHPSVLFRREIVQAAGGYDESFPYGQDWQLWKRLKARDVRFALLDEPLLWYRVSASAVSFKNFRMPSQAAHRNALTCLKNRDRKRFWHFWHQVDGGRQRFRLLGRFLLGEPLILYARLLLKALRLR